MIVQNVFLVGRHWNVGTFGINSAHSSFSFSSRSEFSIVIFILLFVIPSNTMKLLLELSTSLESKQLCRICSSGIFILSCSANLVEFTYILHYGRWININTMHSSIIECTFDIMHSVQCTAFQVRKICYQFIWFHRWNWNKKGLLIDISDKLERQQYHIYTLYPSIGPVVLNGKFDENMSKRIAFNTFVFFKLKWYAHNIRFDTISSLPVHDMLGSRLSIVFNHVW